MCSSSGVASMARFGGGAGGPWGQGRPHRPWRFRRVHQPGVVEPRVGWLQVPGELRVPAGSQAVRIEEPTHQGLSRQHQVHRVPGRARSFAPFPPWLAALGSAAYWGIGSFRHPPTAAARHETIEAEEPVIDTTKSGGASSTTTPFSRTTTLDSCSASSARRWMSAPPGPLRRVDRAERSGDRWNVTMRDVELGGPSSTHREDRHQCRRPVRRRPDEHWGVRTEHRIVYSKGIHLIVPGSPPTNGSGVLRRHPASLLRDPDGQALDDRHHRHPGRRARHPCHRRRPQLPARSDQCSARPAAAADGGRRRRRAMRGATPCREDFGRRHEGRRLDVSSPANTQIEVDQTAKVVTIFGGKLTDCLNVGEEVAEAVGRSASRSSRTPARGTASRPEEPAARSTGRLG